AHRRTIHNLVVPTKLGDLEPVFHRPRAGLPFDPTGSNEPLLDIIVVAFHLPNRRLITGRLSGELDVEVGGSLDGVAWLGIYGKEDHGEALGELVVVLKDGERAFFGLGSVESYTAAVSRDGGKDEVVEAGAEWSAIHVSDGDGRSSE
ncbi:unnamed protein product, partial [Linum tenue]